ncbi:MAG: ABC transporter permease [Bacteroidota bacterium]|nr:ABC transporter permease [Bacteroidota bacterium]
MNSFNQFTAMLAITKASLLAIFRSPSSVVFGFAFPFIFIVVFGFMGNSGAIKSYKVAIDDNADTANQIYSSLKNTQGITIKKYADKKLLDDDLKRGKIAGIINIQKNTTSNPPYIFTLKSTTSSNDQWPQFKTLIESIINQLGNKNYPGRPVYAEFPFDYKKDITEIRQYKTIDFILPGQLGFSLLASGVFGVAFMFFNLRNTLVLKRFFATPISRAYIIMGEMLSRVLFQMLTAFVIILAGKFMFGFTLIHGLETFIELIILSFIGLIVFMGFGFIISGLAKNDSTIPPFANLITLPQFLISGTFFPIDVFPKWLQWIAQALPLTHLNNALRAVAFEGTNLWDERWEIGIMLIWGIVVYAIAIKVFKWE